MPELMTKTCSTFSISIVYNQAKKSGSEQHTELLILLLILLLGVNVQSVSCTNS